MLGAREEHTEALSMTTNKQQIDLHNLCESMCNEKLKGKFKAILGATRRSRLCTLRRRQLRGVQAAPTAARERQLGKEKENPEKIYKINLLLFCFGKKLEREGESASHRECRQDPNNGARCLC